MDYTSLANAATTMEALQTAMTQIDTIAQSEKAVQGQLATSATMWTKSTTALDDVLATFPQLSRDLLGSWKSPADSSLFDQAQQASTNSLAASRDSTTRAPSALTTMSEAIGATATATATAKGQIDELMKKYQAALAYVLPADLAALEAEFVAQGQPIVQKAGADLNTLAERYTITGPQLLEAGQELKWDGPGAGNSMSTGTGAKAAGPSGTGTSSGSGAAGEQSGAGAAGAGAGTGAAGAGAGAGAAGAGAGAAGAGETGGEEAGDDGGGTGLAGVGTIPKPPVALPPGSLPTPSLPGTVPVGGVPLPPLGSGLTPVGQMLGSGGKAKLPGLGGLGSGGLGGGGGGGLPGGGLAGGKPGASLPSAGEQAIPRAGEQLTSPQQAATGRPPAAPGAPGQPGTTGPASGSSTPPPMMPPGGMGAAGAGGSAGRTGAGAIRPGGRGRSRQTGDTPGVPAGLRGKAGQAGAFPSAPASTRRRQEKDQDAETLQLLDEELWTVEENASSVPKQVRRLAN